MKEYFRVKKTPCYPRAYKVYPVERFGESNDLSMFFATEKDAQLEADRLNQNIANKERTKNEK